MAKGDEGRLGRFTYYLMNVAQSAGKGVGYQRTTTYAENEYTTTHKLQSHRVQT